MKDIADNFVTIHFTLDNLDRFVVRKSILRALQENLPDFKGRLLDVGCGKMPYKDYIFKHSPITEYVGLDIETAIKYDARVRADFSWDGVTMPFEKEAFDTIMATEVLEHCPAPDVTLKEVMRVLKPGGRFFFTTPFLWNLHEVPFDEYRYTPFSMERLLRDAGFRQVQVKAAGGWHASMAQMLGLWVRRSPLSPRKRKILSLAIKPVIKRLMSMASAEKVDFSKAPMINTLYGTAIK